MGSGVEWAAGPRGHQGAASTGGGGGPEWQAGAAGGLWPGAHRLHRRARLGARRGGQGLHGLQKGLHGHQKKGESPLPPTHSHTHTHARTHAHTHTHTRTHTLQSSSCIHTHAHHSYIAYGGVQLDMVSPGRWARQDTACTDISLCAPPPPPQHHCRKCGGVYCGACSTKRFPLLVQGYSDPVRVCGKCYTILTKGS